MRGKSNSHVRKCYAKNELIYSKETVISERRTLSLALNKSKNVSNVAKMKLRFPDSQKMRVGYHMDHPILVSVPGQ